MIQSPVFSCRIPVISAMRPGAISSEIIQLREEQEELYVAPIKKRLNTMNIEAERLSQLYTSTRRQIDAQEKKLKKINAAIQIKEASHQDLLCRANSLLQRMEEALEQASKDPQSTALICCYESLLQSYEAVDNELMHFSIGYEIQIEADRLLKELQLQQVDLSHKLEVLGHELHQDFADLEVAKLKVLSKICLKMFKSRLKLITGPEYVKFFGT